MSLKGGFRACLPPLVITSLFSLNTGTGMLFLWRIYQVQQASETSVHNQIGDSDDNAVCDIKNVVSDKISHLCRQRSPLAPRAPFIPILFLVFLAFLCRHALIAYVQLAFPFCSFRKSDNWWIDFICVWQRPLLIPILMKHLPNFLCFWLGFHLPQIQIEFVANMMMVYGRSYY